MKNCAIYTRVSTSMQTEVEYKSCFAKASQNLALIIAAKPPHENDGGEEEWTWPGLSGEELMSTLSDR